MTDWWGWVSSAFKLGPSRSAAIAALGAVVFYLRSKDLLPFEIPALVLMVIGLAAIGFGLFAIFDLIAAMFRGLQALGRIFARCLEHPQAASLHPAPP